MKGQEDFNSDNVPNKGVSYAILSLHDNLLKQISKMMDNIQVSYLILFT